jgi:stress response protein YsnF
MNEDRIISQQAETHTSTAGDKAEQRMQLLGEELDVRKEQVQKGEVRLRNVDGIQSVSEDVRREELRIDEQATGQSSVEKVRERKKSA